MTSAYSNVRKGIYGTVFKTDYPTELEKAIHHILTIRGRKNHVAPGNEWFYTNANEIDSIYSLLMYDVFES